MEHFELDGRLCRDRAAFCARLSALLRFPAWSGNNLDALHDCLSSLPQPTELTITHFDTLAARLGDWGARLRRMLLETADGLYFRLVLPTEPAFTASAANAAGRTLERALLLRDAPIALRLLRDEAEIPSDSRRPLRDEGRRLSLCQAFSLVRRERSALTLLPEDLWCARPLRAYRLCPPAGTDAAPADSGAPEKNVCAGRPDLPLLRREPPLGLALAPLESCAFAPELVCVYCLPAQARRLTIAARDLLGEPLPPAFEPAGSCVDATVPVLNGREFCLAFPSPDERAYARTGRDEVLFTLRGDLLGPLADALQRAAGADRGCRGGEPAPAG
jgi:uncharacterized protein (DUF169 family)/RNAse (barnase) inhibitor barstar